MGSHVTVSLQVWMTDTKLEQLHTDLQKLNITSETYTENSANSSPKINILSK